MNRVAVTEVTRQEAMFTTRCGKIAGKFIGRIAGLFECKLAKGQGKEHNFGP